MRVVLLAAALLLLLPAGVAVQCGKPGTTAVWKELMERNLGGKVTAQTRTLYSMWPASMLLTQVLSLIGKCLVPNAFAHSLHSLALPNREKAIRAVELAGHETLLFVQSDRRLQV